LANHPVPILYMFCVYDVVKNSSAIRYAHSFLFYLQPHMAVTCGRGTKKKKIIIMIRVFVRHSTGISIKYIILWRLQNLWLYMTIAKEWILAAGGHPEKCIGCFCIVYFSRAKVVMRDREGCVVYPYMTSLSFYSSFFVSLSIYF